MNHDSERRRISPVALLMEGRGRVEPPVIFLHVKFRKECENSKTEPMAIQFPADGVEERLQDLAALGVLFSPAAKECIRKEAAANGKALVI